MRCDLSYWILGAIGGLLVLIAGIVGGEPFVGLRLKAGDNTPTAAITNAVRSPRNHLVRVPIFIRGQGRILSSLPS